MPQIPLGWMFGALGVLLVLSAFFSIAETAMMAINRYRLKHLVAHGDASALRVAELLKRTDRLLGGILIGNTLSITGATTVAGFIAAHFFAQGLFERLNHGDFPLRDFVIVFIFAHMWRTLRFKPAMGQTRRSSNLRVWGSGPAPLEQSHLSVHLQSMI